MTIEEQEAVNMNKTAVVCAEAPTNGAELEYIIYKLPNHNVVN